METRLILSYDHFKRNNNSRMNKVTISLEEPFFVSSISHARKTREYGMEELQHVSHGRPPLSLAQTHMNIVCTSTSRCVFSIRPSHRPTILFSESTYLLHSIDAVRVYRTVGLKSVLYVVRDGESNGGKREEVIHTVEFVESVDYDSKTKTLAYKTRGEWGHVALVDLKEPSLPVRVLSKNVKDRLIEIQFQSEWVSIWHDCEQKGGGAKRVRLEMFSRSTGERMLKEDFVCSIQSSLKNYALKSVFVTRKEVILGWRCAFLCHIVTSGVFNYQIDCYSRTGLKKLGGVGLEDGKDYIRKMYDVEKDGYTVLFGFYRLQRLDIFCIAEHRRFYMIQSKTFSIGSVTEWLVAKARSKGRKRRFILGLKSKEEEYQLRLLTIKI